MLFRSYVRHVGGTSFGTKFEGLPVSMNLSDALPGLYHAGSVGIIMSGWLGTINYGVITANKIDQALFDLYEEGAISYEDALRNADSVNELRLKIKLEGQESKDKDVMSGIEHLNIV